MPSARFWRCLRPDRPPIASWPATRRPLPIGALARGMVEPSRLVGMHFFNPPVAMKLVELAGHGETSPEAMARARDLAVRAGKVVVACADRPGFVVNRCARPFYGEALAMIEEGLTPSDIDAAMLAAGYRMGPFQLIDLIGADVHLAATLGIWRAMDCHPRYHVFDRLIERVAAGELGRKSGRVSCGPIRPAPRPTGPT